MTQQEFLDQLEKIAERFEWTLEPEPGRPMNPNGRERLAIQGRAKDAPSTPFDPLRAVCYAETGKSFDDRSWLPATRALAMQPSEAAELLAAAQDKVWQDVGGGTCQIVGKLVSIRNAMLGVTRATRSDDTPGALSATP